MFLNNIISVLFYFLFFCLPLIFFPTTSEIFEFNKIIFLYFMTILITAFWIIKMIFNKKFIFKKTILDLPFLLFLLSQILSTILSIDFRTSFLGYYSRFQGGLLSTFCYLLLYWALVSNLEKKQILKTLKVVLLSGFLVSCYAFLQHFGIDKDLWIQDVQNRVFSTFGQPNWLAAWIIILLPLSWIGIVDSKIKSWRFLVSFFFSSFFFLILIFTKSRSGILAFAIVDLLFWLILFLKSQTKKEIFQKLIITNLLFLVLVLVWGTPLTPNLKQIVNQDFNSSSTPAFSPNEPALETGGTESGKIRAIVWKGAWNLFKKYPLLGSGVETFAFSFYETRPMEQNLVSEWDFLYNKAHNEYLNFLATTGLLGFSTYLSFIAVSLFIFLKNFKEGKEFKNYHLAFFTGFSGILITNFFGFSVTNIAFLFFLLPGLSLVLGFSKEEKDKPIKITTNNFQKMMVVLILLLAAYLIYLNYQYWSADILFNQGKNLNNQGQYPQARTVLVKAIEKSPREAIFWDEISQTDTFLSNLFLENKDEKNAQNFAQQALGEINTAKNLSSRNLNIRRNEVILYLKLSGLNPAYLQKALLALVENSQLAPTDAKIFYNIGLTYARLGQIDKAQETLEKTIEMKANYRDARFALALLYEDLKRFGDAKVQLEYILNYIEPDDKLVQDELSSLNAKK